MYAVVAEAPASLIVLIWLVVCCHVVMTGQGVSMAVARPAVHGLELVARPERLIVVEWGTTMAL